MRARLARVRRAVPAGDTAWALAVEATLLVSVTLSFWLLVDRLGAEAYGGYVGLFALIGPAIAFSHSGVSLTIYEHITGLQEDRRQVAAVCLTLIVLLGAGLTVLVTVLAAALVPNIGVVTALLFVAAELFFGAIASISIALVQATEGFAAASRLRILATVARAAMLVTLAAADALTLPNLAVAQVAVAIAVMVGVRLHVERRLGLGRRFRAVDRSYVKTAALYSVGVTSSGVQADSDKVVMASAGHLADNGRYGAAYRIINLAQLPINAVIGATHLSFLDRGRAATGELSQVQRAKRLSLAVLIYTVPVIAAIIVAAPLIPKVLGSEFDGTVTMVRLLTPVILLRGLSPFPSNGLMGLGCNRLRTIILVGCALFSLGLYIAVIPTYSWRGAIVSSLITEAVMAVAMWIALLWAQRQADLAHGPRFLIREPAGVLEAPGVGR